MDGGGVINESDQRDRYEPPAISPRLSAAIGAESRWLEEEQQHASGPVFRQASHSSAHARARARPAALRELKSSE